MEAVASHFIILIILIRKSVHISLFWHCLVESCVKYTYHRSVRHQFLACCNTDQICRIVKRRKLVALLYCFLHFVSDHNRRSEFSPPCTTRCPTAPISSRLLTTPVSGFVQCLDHKLDCLCMCGHRFVRFFFFLRLSAGKSVFPSIPIRSQSPFASTSSDSALISWNFREELPQLITNTFIFFPPNNIYLPQGPPLRFYLIYCACALNRCDRYHTHDILSAAAS